MRECKASSVRVGAGIQRGWDGGQELSCVLREREKRCERLSKPTASCQSATDTGSSNGHHWSMTHMTWSEITASVSLLSPTEGPAASGARGGREASRTDVGPQRGRSEVCFLLPDPFIVCKTGWTFKGRNSTLHGRKRDLLTPNRQVGLARWRGQDQTASHDPQSLIEHNNAKLARYRKALCQAY